MLKKEKFIHYRTYKEKFIFKIIIYHSKAFASLIIFLTMILTLIIPLGIIRYFELDVQYEEMSSFLKKIYRYTFGMFYISTIMSILLNYFFKKVIIKFDGQQIFIITSSGKILLDEYLSKLKYIDIVENKKESSGVCYIKFKQSNRKTLFLKMMKKNFLKNKNIYYQEFFVFKEHLEYHLQNFDSPIKIESKKHRTIKKYILSESL